MNWSETKWTFFPTLILFKLNLGERWFDWLYLDVLHVIHHHQLLLNSFSQFFILKQRENNHICLFTAQLYHVALSPSGGALSTQQQQIWGFMLNTWAESRKVQGSICVLLCVRQLNFYAEFKKLSDQYFSYKGGGKKKKHWTAAHIPHLTTNTFHRCHWRVSLYPQDFSTGFSQGFVGLYNTILLCVNCFHLTIEAFKNESNVKPCVYVT